MTRSRFILTAGTILTFGIALAAQPTASNADRVDSARARPAQSWAPGSELPMATFENGVAMAAPPR
jgi:hypothetical protein